MDANHIVLLGRQGSGKTTLSRELNGYGFRRVISYTTRPPRSGELDGIDYNFVDDYDFDHMAKRGELVALREYKTMFGLWKYGLLIGDINRPADTVTIIDPKGFAEIRDSIEGRFAVFIDIPKDVRMARLLARGDYSKEIERREKSDDEQMFDYLDHNYQDLCDMRVAQIRPPRMEALRVMETLRAFNRGDIDYDGTVEDKSFAK